MVNLFRAELKASIDNFLVHLVPNLLSIILYAVFFSYMISRFQGMDLVGDYKPIRSVIGIGIWVSFNKSIIDLISNFQQKKMHFEFRLISDLHVLIFIVANLLISLSDGIVIFTIIGFLQYKLQFFAFVSPVIFNFSFFAAMLALFGGTIGFSLLVYAGFVFFKELSGFWSLLLMVPIFLGGILIPFTETVFSQVIEILFPSVLIVNLLETQLVESESFPIFVFLQNLVLLIFGFLMFFVARRHLEVVGSFPA